jgi:5'-3' exonuclease
MAEVHVVFIFDGKAPPDKDDEHKRRVEQREKSAGRLEKLNEMLNNLSLTDDQLRSGIKDLNMRVKEIEGLDTNSVLGVSDTQPTPEEFINASVPSTDVPSEPSDTIVQPSLIEQVAERVPEGSAESALRSTLRQVYDKRMTRNVKLEPHHIEMVKTYMADHGVPFIQAPGEAEAFGVFLIEHYADKFAPAIISEDSDTLTYGTPYWLSDYSPKDHTCRSISLMQIIQKLEFTGFQQFQQFCILSECDYNARIPGWGCTKLYKSWIRSGRELEDFLVNEVEITDEARIGLRLERCVVLFEHYGQDSVEQRDAVLKARFDQWLSEQDDQVPFWSLKKEAELSNLNRQSDVFGEDGEDVENVRLSTSWRFRHKD